MKTALNQNATSQNPTPTTTTRMENKFYLKTRDNPNAPTIRNKALVHYIR